MFYAECVLVTTRSYVCKVIGVIHLHVLLPSVSGKAVKIIHIKHFLAPSGPVPLNCCCGKASKRSADYHKLFSVQ